MLNTSSLVVLNTPMFIGVAKHDFTFDQLVFVRPYFIDTNGNVLHLQDFIAVSSLLAI